MLLPTRYTSMLEEYEALTTAVTIWDVGAQRQVEIQGPDAAALTQYLTTRDTTRISPGQARYTFICNHAGGILNDPVLLKLAEDHYWLSLADRDILLWAQAVAAERAMDVAVREPDVSPLQIQGPKSGDLIGDLFGAEVRDQKYYNFVETELAGVPLVVSRTGWSGEFGYEIFLRDGSRGEWLWDRLFAAGDKHGVSPACPNQIRRIEGGMLSYGTDMDDSVTPLELGFDKFVQLDGPDDFIGKAALTRQAADGVERKLTGVRVGGDPILYNPEHHDVLVGGSKVGRLTSVVYSPRFGANLGFVFIAAGQADPGTKLEVVFGEGTRPAVTEPIPFVAPTKSN
jgi:aminomethyltransferase